MGSHYIIIFNKRHNPNTHLKSSSSEILVVVFLYTKILDNLIYPCLVFSLPLKTPKISDFSGKGNQAIPPIALNKHHVLHKNRADQGHVGSDIVYPLAL